MPGPWIDNGTLAQKVADMLKKDVATLEAYWTRFIADSNNDAAEDITVILLDKGFTVAQIDGWDNRVMYNPDIALFHAFTKATGLAQYDQKAIDKLDRRPLIRSSSQVMISGVITKPGAADGAGMETGCMEAGETNTDRDRYGRESRRDRL
jgi:hypothetical protein